MIRNYLKTALRNFTRDTGYSTINVLGLAVGMTCSLLIALYIWDELRFDDFHQEKNLYRVALRRLFTNNETSYAQTPSPMADVLIKEYAEVKATTRIFKLTGDVRVRQNEDLYFEKKAVAADSNFFDIFSIRLLQGNPKEALRLRNSVVLTESAARKYFGTEDPVGKQLFIFTDTTSYFVTGVSEDVPANCHFTYDLLLSFVTFPLSDNTSWASYNVFNYVILDSPDSKAGLEAKFPKLVEQYFGPEVENILGKKYEEYVAAGNIHYYHLQPIRDIHLYSNYQSEFLANGDIRYVYLFGAVCFFILFVAGVNFTNLSTARSFRRAKEIGIRKVHGSLKRQLVFQFLTESLLVTALSLTISVLAVVLLMQSFNDFTAKSIRLTDLNPMWAGGAVFMLMILIGILAGVYPAFVVSAFQPISILKGKIQSGKGKSILRNVLVVAQFGVSVVLIISTLVIYRQLQYMRDQKLGFDKEHILVVERANSLGAQRHAFNEEVRQIPGIIALGNAFNIPGRITGGGTFQPIGSEATERIIHSTAFCDYQFPEALGVTFLAGRNFSEDAANDSIAVVVNEALIKRAGWKTAEAAIGQKIKPTFNLAVQYEIIGVVKDFNYQSLRASIEPFAFYGNRNRNRTYNPTNCVIRLAAGTDARVVLSAVDEKWKKFVPGQNFEPVFLEEEFNNQYRQEERFGKIFTLFSGLAIFIAAIGVVGLSTFMASQRTKEIGIRKVNGASLTSLLFLLSKDFIRLVLVANILFWPVAWYGLSQWLSNYPFRTQLTASLFLATGLATALIVMLSVIWQSVRAAMANPVQSLRSE